METLPKSLRRHSRWWWKEPETRRRTLGGACRDATLMRWPYWLLLWIQGLWLTICSKPLAMVGTRVSERKVELIDRASFVVLPIRQTIWVWCENSETNQPKHSRKTYESSLVAWWSPKWSPEGPDSLFVFIRMCCAGYDVAQIVRGRLTKFSDHVVRNRLPWEASKGLEKTFLVP